MNTHTVSNDTLRGLGVLWERDEYETKQFRKEATYHDTGKMSIENPAVFVVSPVYLKKMGSEVLDDSFVVIGPFSKRSDTEDRVNDIESIVLEALHYFWTLSPLSNLARRRSVLSEKAKPV